mgnify:CR=1 FL=1
MRARWRFSTANADDMSEPALTREQILEAAMEVLRRYGPAKATVVDVARALGVSHGSVYRHFPSKAALRDAVTERWLARMSAPLVEIAAEDGPAAERLARWVTSLAVTKRQKVRGDPELFATYQALFGDIRAVIHAHVDHLVDQLTTIIADGMRRGEFAEGDPAETARAVFDATSRFHNPAHAAEWDDPAIDRDLAGVLALVLRGLARAEG